MRDIVRQLRTDFRLVPRFVDEYVVHTPREEAIRASRQVCGVTHYLSLMATGEADMRKCAAFGVAITCIDEVTDELEEELYPGPVAQAFMDNPPFESLRCLSELSDIAGDDRFEYAVRQVCRAQDMSRAQTKDITNGTIEHITQSKGGWSARANLALVKGDIPEEEWGYMWQFGFTMQMLDDYLDQQKDAEAGLSTPFTDMFWDAEALGTLIDTTEEKARGLWGSTSALERFFTICRIHRRLGKIENETSLRASWLAPGYL